MPNFIYYSNFIKFKFLTLYYTDNSKKYFRKIKYFWIILFGFCFMYNANPVPKIKIRQYHLDITLLNKHTL